MNPLRKLAKGHEYRVSEPNGALLVLPTKGTFYWEYSKAPAECFADAAVCPICKNAYGRYTDGRSIPHTCVGDAEEPTKPSMSDGYRSTDDIEPGDGLAHTLDERPDENPAEKKPQESMRCGEYPYCYDMPKPAEKEPEPVIGCKLLREDGGSLTEAHGRVFYPVGEAVDVPGLGAFVAVEGGLDTALITSHVGQVAVFECYQRTDFRSDINLCHYVSVEDGTPVPLTLPSGVQTYRRVRRLPEIPMDKLHPDLRKEVEAWQAKHKPEPPPRKYEDGQCVKTCGKIPYRYTVLGAALHAGASQWWYELQPTGGYPATHLWESEIRPCPPPLSDAQRRLQPGDKVTVRKRRWDAEGKPLVGWEGEASWTIFTTFLSSGRVRARLENGRGAYKSEWLHNLDPV